MPPNNRRPNAGGGRTPGEPNNRRSNAGGGRTPGEPNNRRRRRDPVRALAYEVLRAVDEREAYANLLLPSLLRERGITGRDAALATELTYGTLRGRGTYDAVLRVCSDRPLAKIDPPLLDVLRLGAHQLLSTRIPPHAAVGTTVDLAAGHGPRAFANAILRKVSARDLDAWLAIVTPDDENGRLSVVHSHPKWIINAFRDVLGTGELEALLAADNERPGVTLVARPGRATVAELNATPARYSPYGAYLSEGDPAAVPAIAQGRAAVQDEASQLVALALTRVDLAAPKPAPATAPDGLTAGRPDLPEGRVDLSGGRAGLLGGRADGLVAGSAGLSEVWGGERWLDLCAGPGGKAGLLSALAREGGARLLACDVQPHRARLVRRTVDPGTPVAVVDGAAPAWRPGSFDRVIADVPCTGLGALRRRPEARWRRGPNAIAELGPLQRKLLTTALEAVRPGGVVAYVTCSPHLAETRVVVDDVLRDRDDVERLDARTYLPEVPDLGDGPYAQFWPHRHGTDAMFLALLRRR